MPKNFIKLKKVPGVDRLLSLIQDNVDDLLRQYFDVAMLRGILIEDVVLPSLVTTEVTHGLGREHQGFVLAGSNANVVVWEPSATNTPKTTLNLRSNGNCTVNVWVY